MLTRTIKVALSVGELVDKLTILRIKEQRIADPRKLENIQHEHGLLRAHFDAEIDHTPELEYLAARLMETNETLWDLEEAIRDKECKGTFDEEFIQIARGVYMQNDLRAELKRQINALTGSSIVEEKSFE